MKLARVYLMPGVEYDVRVRGVSGSSRGAWSSTIQHTTVGNGDPTPPSALLFAAYYPSLIIKWTRSTDKDTACYYVYLSDSSIPVDVNGKVTDVLPYIITDADYAVSPYTAYLWLYAGATDMYCRVEAVGKNGNRSAATDEGHTALGGLPGWHTSQRAAVQVVTEDVTLNALLDYATVCSATGTIIVTLPEATGSGQLFAVKNVGSGQAIVSATGSVIDAAATHALDQWESVQVVDYSAGAWATI